MVECLDRSMTTWSVHRPVVATATCTTDSGIEQVRVALSLAVSLELVGAARHLLEAVCQHAKSRTQFGVPIGAFQAVQVLLAEAAVDLAGASDVLNAMLDEIGSATDLASQTGHGLGLILASRTAAHVAASAQQVFGAISYTREHEFGRYLRRIHVLTEIVGASRLAGNVGHRILADGTLPAVGPYSPRGSAGGGAPISSSS
jgi:alkylation response protein AidB-like acyl-CoA dehydrogenase